MSPRSWRPPRLTPEAYRRITGLSVVLLTLIVVTGGAVRLTGSGLGCTDWPNCSRNHLVPTSTSQYRAWIEFGNRTITGLVCIVVVAAVLGALARVPRRRDLTRLSLAMVGGLVLEIVFGGVLVLSGLWPPFLILHFLVSQLLVVVVVVLHHRAGWPDDAVTPRPKVTPDVVRAGRVLLAIAALALVTGTIVTGAGPHSGSNGSKVAKRLPLPVADAARVHGTIDMLFLAAVLWLVWRLRRTGAPLEVVRALETVLVIGVLQAAVGYTQYFTGVPVLLVGLHILGATCLWISVLWFHLGLFTTAPEPRESGNGPHASDDDAGGDRTHGVVVAH